MWPDSASFIARWLEKRIPLPNLFRDVEGFHPRSQRGGFQSQQIGGTILALNFPLRFLESIQNVLSLKRYPFALCDDSSAFLIHRLGFDLIDVFLRKKSKTQLATV